MHRITKLYAENYGIFRERQQFDISKYLLLVGENGSGKSIVLNIPQLVIFGYIPSKRDDIGKQNQSVFHHFAYDISEPLIVGVETTDKTIERRFVPQKGGKVSQEIRIDGILKERISDGEEIIADIFGTQTVYFNIREFFEMSAERKRNFVFQFSDGSVDITNIKNIILWETLMSVDSNQAESVLEYKYEVDAFSDLDATQQSEAVQFFTTKLYEDDGLEPIRPTIASIDWSGDLIQAFANASKSLKDLAKQARRDKKRAGESKKELVERQAELSTLTTPVQHLKSERDQCQSAIQKLAAEINQMQQIQQSIRDHQRTLAKKKSLLSGLQNQIDAWRDEDARLETQIGMYQNNIEIVQQIETLQESIEQRMKRLHRVRQEMDEACPTCLRAIHEGERDLLIAELQKQVQSEKEQVTHLTQLLTIKWDNQSSSELRDTIEEMKDSRVIKESDKNNQITRRDEVEKDIQELEQQIDRLQAQEVDIQTLRQDLKGHTERLNTLNTNIEQKERAEEVKTGIAKAGVKLEDAKAMLEIIKHATTGLQAVRDQYLREMSQPFTQAVNNFLQSVEPFWTFQVHFEPVFEFAIVKENVSVPVNSLSDGEFAEVTFALIFAMVQHQSTNKVTLLELETGEMDDTRITEVLRVIPDFADGSVSNVMLARWSDVDFEFNDFGQWERINFSA